MVTWKEAERRFVDSFDKLGKRAFVFRFQDTATAKALNGRGAFTTAQPSDFLVVSEGQMFFAEVKSSQDKTSFHFNNIQARQIAAARRVVAAGGNYLFFIMNRVTERWYAVPALVIHQHPRKHMTWVELEDYTVEL